ncbi:NADH dehydrogenase ubiquinone Fe-S protein 4 [Candidatus Bandiella euplotis]|nr:NADH dehydrogenase ubiquinone Fe-S protein 4 [Candidatus Bandiella woodruffii]
MTVKIYENYKLPTQSANICSNIWVIEFIPQEVRFQEQVMGWTGATDMSTTQVKLRFQSKEAAIKFACDRKLEYRVQEKKKKECVVQSYTDNYKT